MTRLAILGVLGVLGACDEPLDQRLAIIDEPRILAITAEPAEGPPGTAVTYGVLVAGPDGPIAQPPTWAYCLAGKPPTEDNIVSPVCLDDTMALPLGDAPTITATLPADGCALFGPDVPAEGFRPRDPDPSGGYYQPIRADVAGMRAFGLSRITCNLPNAPTDVAHEYRTTYVANATPSLAPLALVIDDALVAFDAVPAGADVTLVASWTPSAAETYLYYDQRTQRLVTRRETLRVSWYATAGALAVDATGVADDDGPVYAASTTWRAPDAPGTVWMWLVLRDDRGGIATQTIELTVR